MLQQIFLIVFPLVAIVSIGFFYGRKHEPDMAAANQLNLDLFVPALIFSVLSAKSFDVQAFGQLAMVTFAVVLGSGLIAWPVAKLLKYDIKTLVPPMMFSNTGNMGLPLAVFAFGEQALPAAVVIFIVENTLHFSVGMRIMDSRSSLISILRIPMVLATIAGLGVSVSGFAVPQVISISVEMVGQIAIPLMLFSLGVRLNDIEFKDWHIGLTGAILCPLSGLLIFLILLPLLSLPELQHKQLLLFAVMPPAVLNFMVAEKYSQEPKKVAAIVMMGNLASLAIIPLALTFVL